MHVIFATLFISLLTSCSRSSIDHVLHAPVPQLKDRELKTFTKAELLTWANNVDGLYRYTGNQLQNFSQHEQQHCGDKISFAEAMKDSPTSVYIGVWFADSKNLDAPDVNENNVGKIEKSGGITRINELDDKNHTLRIIEVSAEEKKGFSLSEISYSFKSEKAGIVGVECGAELSYEEAEPSEKWLKNRLTRKFKTTHYFEN